MTPFKGINRVTSPFGYRKSPITGKQELHKGEDIVTTGAWPGYAWLVRECTGGTVIRVTSDKWRGKYVDVQTSPGVFERYQHMHEIYVKAGQTVAQGAILGMAGKTGDSTGVHLHFEVQKNGTAVNPQLWSDVPNVVGAHPGNNNVDGVEPDKPDPPAPTNTLYEFSDIIASAGDGKDIEAMLNEKGIPFTKKAVG